MNWGGQIQDRGDGQYHGTIWRAPDEGGKGERVSWDWKPNPGFSNLHHTDQDTGQHSNDPSTWRTGEQLLGGGCALLFGLSIIVAAILVIAVVVI